MLKLHTLVYSIDGVLFYQIYITTNENHNCEKGGIKIVALIKSF